MDSFYLTLPSNDKTDLSNTPSYFQTRLAKTLYLTGEWEVGLSEISYSKSWFNLREVNEVRVIDEHGASYNSRYKIPPGYYPTEEDLFSVIYDVLKDACQTIADIKDAPWIKYNKYTRTVELLSGRDTDGGSLSILLTPELNDILGIKLSFNQMNELMYKVEDSEDYSDAYFQQKVIKGQCDPFRTYDLKAGIQSLYLYCDIIEPTFVGSSYCDLLRVIQVPNKVPFGEQVVLSFNPVFYHKLNTDSLSSIKVRLEDPFGNRIPFEFGETIVTLHVKKK